MLFANIGVSCWLWASKSVCGSPDEFQRYTLFTKEVHQFRPVNFFQRSPTSRVTGSDIFQLQTELLPVSLCHHGPAHHVVTDNLLESVLRQCDRLCNADRVNYFWVLFPSGPVCHLVFLPLRRCDRFALTPTVSDTSDTGALRMCLLETEGWFGSLPPPIFRSMPLEMLAIGETVLVEQFVPENEVQSCNGFG